MTPEARPRVLFARAGPARTGTCVLLDSHVGLTSVLKVSHHQQEPVEDEESESR